MAYERLEEEGLEEEQEQAPMVLPPETPGGPPVVLPVEVVRVQVPPAPVLLPGEVVTVPSSPPAPVLRKEVNGEDLNDLFNVSKEDILGDSEEGMDDLVDVSEEDVMGAGGADMSDLLTVSKEDITGYAYTPRTKRVTTRPPVVTRRPTPPAIIIRRVRQ